MKRIVTYCRATQKPTSPTDPPGTSFRAIRQRTCYDELLRPWLGSRAERAESRKAEDGDGDSERDPENNGVALGKGPRVGVRGVAFFVSESRDRINALRWQGRKQVGHVVLR